jgi:hypothetical protein
VDETSAHEVQASTGRAVAAHEPLWHPEQYAIEDQSNRIFVPGSGDRDVVWRDAHMRTRSHGLCRHASVDGIPVPRPAPTEVPAPTYIASGGSNVPAWHGVRSASFGDRAAHDGS